MAFYTRTKRVTDPLDERVKDRIIGREPVYVSSGSEHSAYDNDLSFSCHCLSELNHCFLQQGVGEGCNVNANEDVCQVTGKKCDSDSEYDMDRDSDRIDQSMEKVKSIFRNQNVDRYRNVLLSNVLKGIDVFWSIKSNKQIFHRNVMFFLQKIGYNSAICKTKWQRCGGLTEGNYEFIDVMCVDSGARYFIDLNFVGEFEIARETNQYRRLLNHLPTVFVGKSEALKQIVKLISDEARRSLKNKGLSLPPWRKNRFMQNKWFGPYRRTTNYTPTSSSDISSSTVVKCSYVGFNAVNTPFVTASTSTR